MMRAFLFALIALAAVPLARADVLETTPTMGVATGKIENRDVTGQVSRFARLTVAATSTTTGALQVDTAGPIFGMLHAVETDPGVTSPTANWDLTVEDDHGLDVLQGEGANRSATTTEIELPAITNAGTTRYGPVPLGSVLTFKVLNAGSQKDFEIILHIER